MAVANRAHPWPLAGQRRCRVAVLSKKTLGTHRYDQWLGHEGCEVVLFAEDTPATRAFLGATQHRFARAHLFGGWKKNRAIDLAVLTEHRSRPFGRVVALSECDLVRAAELRECLGICGQSVASATAFRDKPVMKKLARDAGLETPAYRLVNSVGDLMDFAAAHAWTVVVKPVDGAGSADTVCLRGICAVESWVRKKALHCDEPARYLAEEWIDAPMLSVDGVAQAGGVRAAMVGAYAGTCLRSVSALEPHGILLLDHGDPRSTAALDFVACLLKGLPAADELMSFHCELFDVPRRGLVFCEIACRTGGGNINAMARQMLALDLEEAACRGQAGLPVDVPLASAPPGKVMGDLLLPHPGRPLAPDLPPCGLPGVLSVSMHPEVAATTTRAAKVSQYAVDALYEADDHAELWRLYARLESWLRDVLR